MFEIFQLWAAHLLHFFKKIFQLWAAHLLQRVDPEGVSVGSFQGDQGGLACVHCLPPAARAEAPTITRSQTRETPGPRCREVIAHALCVVEEVLGHLSAHRVTSSVPRIRPALAIPVPAGHGGGRANLQILTINIELVAVPLPSSPIPLATRGGKIEDNANKNNFQMEIHLSSTSSSILGFYHQI